MTRKFSVTTNAYQAAVLRIYGFAVSENV